MLPRPHRLTKDKDFKRIFKQGKGFREQILVLKTIDNSLKKSRFGFIVSNKISKRATVRHKIKRRLRKIISLRINNITKGKDVILVAQPGMAEKTYQEIEKVMTRLLIKARLIS